MKICVFINELNIGGAERQSMLLAKALQNRYETYYVILHSKNIEKKYLEFIKNNNIQIYFLKGNIFSKIFSFTKFLKKHKISIIFSYLFSNNIIGAIAGSLAGIPYILGGIRSSFIKKYKFVIMKILHNHFLSYTVFNNYAGKDILVQKGFNPDNIIVIPNCYESYLPLKIRDKKERINILSVSRFSPKKDFYTALKALKYLINKLSNNRFSVHYYIVGYGKLNDNINQFIESQNLETYTTIVHKPDNVDMYYDLADIYLCSSVIEGLSNSIMEAMHHTLPIIATYAGDNNKLVEDGISGYLTRLKDFKTIAEKLFILATSHTKRIEFGKAGYLLLKKNYSFQIFQNRYFKLIEELK